MNSEEHTEKVHSPLIGFFERVGLARFFWAVVALLTFPIVAVTLGPSVYEQLTYETNEERLAPVLQGPNEELAYLAEMLVSREREVIRQSEYSNHLWIAPERALYNLHRDQPKSFAVSSEWLIDVSKTESITQEDLLKLQALAKSTSFLNTAMATDWLISVFNAQSVSESYAVGLSALDEKIRTGKSPVKMPLETNEDLPKDMKQEWYK